MNIVLKKWWFMLVLLPVFCLGAFVIWALDAAGPMPEALVAMESDDQVQVSVDRWLVLEPVNSRPTVGLILYPGARVDPRSYAPLARPIASQGYMVVIVPMPLNFVIFNPSAADEVIAAFPHIRIWAIAGHSLGGSMAAYYSHQNPSQVQGLILWASYPAPSDDLSTQSLAVASVYGTLDGLTTTEDINNSSSRLPANTAWTAILGGNHAQFAWYGPQTGDNPAAISREEQQAQIIAASMALLEKINQYME